MESLLSLLKSRVFLKKLYQNDLPKFEQSINVFWDVMIVEAEKDWILRAKLDGKAVMGWWWVYREWSAGPVFFALNIDTPIDGRICI